MKALFLSLLMLLTVAAGPVPDQVAYIHHGDLWVRPLVGGAARRLTADGGYHSPLWAPSGRRLVVSKGQERWLLEADGARGYKLPDDLLQLRFSPVTDDLAYSDRAGRIGVMDPGGRRRILAEPRKGEGFGNPIWSPDGEWIAYTAGSGQPPVRGYASIWRVSASGAQRWEMYATREAPTPCLELAAWTGDPAAILYWSRPGCSASIAADGLPLMAMPEGGSPHRTVAEAVLLYRDWIAIAPDGAVAVVEGAGRQVWANKRIALLGPGAAAAFPLTPPEQAAIWPEWAPDGTRLAYTGMDDTPDVGGGEAARRALMKRRIWLVARDGNAPRQLTREPGYRDEAPVWSSDGSRILFGRLDERGAQASLWTVLPTGGKPGLLTQADSPCDNEWFGYYGYCDWGRVFDLWRPHGDRARQTQPGADNG